jgi:predicted MFS family arabinose efflux permease
VTLEPRPSADPPDAPATSDPAVGPSRRSRVFADVTPLQLDRGFRAQWLGQLGSAIGRETAKYAFPIHIYLATGSLAVLGVVAALQLAATVVLSLSSGTLSDLFDRRLILVGSLAVMAIATAGLFVLALTPDAPLELVIALGVVVTTFFTMEQPARISSVPRLVAPERLPSAIALTSLNFQGMSVAGPAVAAVMFGLAGLAGAYALQLGGYLWATIMSARMPSLPPADRVATSPIKMLIESFAFVRQRQIILSTFALDLNAMILALPMGSLLPVLLIEAYGVTPEVVGVLLAARGVGAVGAAVFSGWTRSIRALGRAVIAVVLLYCVATLLLGLTTMHFLLAIPILAVTGAADVSSAILRNTIIQTATPDDLRGRVTAIHVLSSAGGPRIGDMRAAAMAAAFGAQGALVLGGGLAVVGVGLAARAFPALRSYRLAGR